MVRELEEAEARERASERIIAECKQLNEERMRERGHFVSADLFPFHPMARR